MRVMSDAPGKLILLGEYAVLEGAPALVGAVARRARVTIDPAVDRSVLHSSMLSAEVSFRVVKGSMVLDETVSEADRNRLGVFKACFDRTLQSLPDGLPGPLRIGLDTSAFFLPDGSRKLGVGSSAALTVALTASLYAWAGVMDARVPDRKRLMNEAMGAHRMAQSNTGSGVDIAASVYGGVFRYELPASDPLSDIRMMPTHLPSDLTTVAIWTGRSASTPEMVANVNRFKQRNERQYRTLMDHMTALSRAGIAALGESDTSAFLDAIRGYRDAMTELGDASGTPIMSDPHREIDAICTGHGVCYKPSGAGGGDLGVLFATNGAPVGEILARLEQAGYPAFDLQIWTHGVRTTIEQLTQIQS